MAEAMAAFEVASTALASLKALYQVYVWAQEIRHCHEDIAEFVRQVDDVAENHQKLRSIRIKLRGSKEPPNQIEECLDSERKAWEHLAKADKILARVYRGGREEAPSWLPSLIARERWVRTIGQESRGCRRDLNNCYMVLKDEITKHELHAQTLGKLTEGFNSTTSQIDMLWATLNPSRG